MLRSTTYPSGTASTFSSLANNTTGCVDQFYAATSLSVDGCAACDAPMIASGPVATACCAGHDVLFSSVATGTAPLSYQWRKGGIPIGGATGSSLALASITAADAGSYDVVVTNACGQETSAAATLTVHAEGPDVTSQPADVAACIGADATFAAAAEAHLGGALSYQWRKDGAPIPGATAPTLTIAVTGLADAGQYDCEVTEVGCGTTTSNPAILTVKNAAPEITLVGAPEIVLECPEMYVELGATAADDCDTGLAVMIGGDPVEADLGAYVITYDASDSQGNAAAQVTRLVRIQDTTPPAISLMGATAVVTECHSPFEDPGAMATDSCDPEPTVVTGGDQLDVNVPGTYVITYRALDEAGNLSPAVSRTVEVRDTTPPEITLNGDATVTVDCPASYEELGAAVADACDPEVMVLVGGDVVDEATPGTYVVTYSATDATGNAAEVSRTVEVRDTTPPVLTVDTTPIVVADADCSGDEVVALPPATAADLCDANPTVTSNAPASFTPGTTQVVFTARDDAGNEASATLEVTVEYGARVEVRAARHTVGQGTRPETSKAALGGIEVRAYERGPGSCAAQQAPNGASWQDYPQIFANCTPINTGIADADGVATIDLPPGDYLLISHLDSEDVYLGEWANDLACGETKIKRLQLLVANGTPRPGKTTRLTGSELLIIEPEYVIWDDSTQAYPFVFESIGEWGVTASVAPPDGFVADYNELTAEVVNELEVVQFAITEEGSDLVPTRTAFTVRHGNRRHTVRSDVGILLTPDYARSRGFDVAALEARGLIVDRGRHGPHGRMAGDAGGKGKETASLAASEKTPSAAHDSPAEAAKTAETGTTLGAPVVTSSRRLSAWPSPFSGNGPLQIAFGLPDGALPPDLDLGVFDVAGRRVATIPTDLMVGRDGVAELTWNGSAELVRGDLAPGVYFLRALAPSVGMRSEFKLVVMR